MPPQQLQSIHFFRGLAALWVALFHLGVIAKQSIDVTFVQGVFRHGFLGVDFFFVLSGFIIYYVHVSDVGKSSSIKPFILKRVFRIYPLLFFLTTLKICYILAVGFEVLPSEKQSSFLILCSYFFLPVPPELGSKPLLDVAWTLNHEMLFYILFALGIRWGNRGFTFFFSFWALCIFVLGLTWWNTSHYLIQFLFHPYNIQFIFGLLLGRLFLRNSKSCIPNYILIFITVLLLSGGILFFDWLVLQQELYQRLFWGIAFALLIYTSLQFEPSLKQYLPRSFLTLGDISYALYLAHSSIFLLLIPHSSNTVSLWIILFFTLLVSYLLSRYFDLPVRRFLRKKYL